MTTEETVSEAIIAFAKRWGVHPNGILLHPRTYIGTSLPCTGSMEFEGIPIFRSPDMPEGKIRFVL